MSVRSFGNLFQSLLPLNFSNRPQNWEFAWNKWRLLCLVLWPWIEVLGVK